MYDKAKTTFGVGAANYKLTFLIIFFGMFLLVHPVCLLKSLLPIVQYACLSPAVRIAQVKKKNLHHILILRYKHS